VSSRRRPQRKVSFRKEVLDVSRVQLNLRQRRFLKKCFLARVRRWTLLAGAFQTRTVVAESAWRQWTRHSPSATQPTSEQIRQNKETTIERAPRGHPGTATSASLHGPTTRPRPTLLAMLQEIPRYSAQHLRKEGTIELMHRRYSLPRRYCLLPLPIRNNMARTESGRSLRKSIASRLRMHNRGIM
jgi:hypothetical protein